MLQLIFLIVCGCLLAMFFYMRNSAKNANVVDAAKNRRADAKAQKQAHDLDNETQSIMDEINKIEQEDYNE